jgi:hypothetical protein
VTERVTFPAARIGYADVAFGNWNLNLSLVETMAESGRTRHEFGIGEWRRVRGLSRECPCICLVVTAEAGAEKMGL